jgi:hypothetical protein
MRAVAALVAVIVSVLVASGCATGKRATTNVNHGVARGCVSCLQQHEVEVARSSNRYFSLFQSAPGKRRCVIPLNTMGSRAAYRGTCRTSVRSNDRTHEPEAIVVFTERWRRPCPPPALIVACLPRWRRHTWRVIEGTTAFARANAKVRVLATRSTGAIAPQDHK